MGTMASGRRITKSLLRRGLPGPVLLAGCATAAEQFGDEPSGITQTEAFERMLVKEYPKELLDAGIGGVTMLELVVDEEGGVQEVRVQKSSGHTALDEAALRLAPLVPFTRPVLLDGRSIGGRITFPVRFDAEEAMAADACGKMVEDIEPYYTNGREVQQMLAREYPAQLRDRRLGGTTMVWLLVDERGSVANQQMGRSSGYAELDEAAMRVSRRVRFSPARHCGDPVAVWVALPITFFTR